MGKKVNNKEPKYAYAYDEERKLVHISALTKDSRDGHIYKCLSCGSVMIPRLGDINIHHFAHKVDVECNNETYLHILSKEILRKRFYSSDSFEISLYQTAKCDLYERCPIQKADEECIREVLEPYDLKKYYCNCLLEDWDPITKKRPDLKLVSNNPQREPIWIEIYVTNPCSDDKIQKNRRIIEIKIETEEQAKSLMTAKIKETPHNYNEVSWDSWNEDSLTINFYNFERNKDLIKPFTCESKGKPIATLLKTGYVQMKKMPCREKEVRFSEGEVAAIILDKDRGDRASLWEKAAFAKYGIGNFKSCLWCMGYRKDYGKTYCYYGKDLGIIGPPKENHAYFCDWRYDPCFSSELPDVVLNKRFTPEQARAMMKNHPKTPTYSTVCSF